jgi:hypothetical protein
MRKGIWSASKLFTPASCQDTDDTDARSIARERTSGRRGRGYSGSA